MAVSPEILTAFRRQGDFCRERGSLFTATLIDAALAEIEAGGPLADIVAGFDGDPGKGALALRIAGALHRLVLEGRGGALAPIYRNPKDNWAVCDIQPALAALTSDHADVFRDYVSRPPQTNEIRRAAALLYGFSSIAETFALPLDLYEIGASGGLLLAWDQFAYDYGAFAWGKSDAVIRAEWRGDKPALASSIQVRARRGCDLDPLDFRDAAHRLRARSYIWPEETVRLALFDEAVLRAQALGIHVEKADALEWLETVLCENAPGAVRVIYHSVFDVYLSDEQRSRFNDLICAAGEKASAHSPFAHLAFTIAETPAGLEFPLDLQIWPSGEKKRLAIAHPHGAWVAPV